MVIIAVKSIMKNQYEISIGTIFMQTVNLIEGYSHMSIKKQFIIKWKMT